MTVASYILQLLSNEEYSFSIKELSEHSSKSKEAIKSELSRLSEKKEIINLRQDYYLILPPRYRSFQRLPIELFINKLFSYLDKTYYVSCLSAARFHGAAHQQLQKDYIITGLPPIRSIEKHNQLKFLSASSWPVSNIQKRKSDAGYFNISSPSLTMVDLIHYQSKLGGLNKQLTVIEELVDELNPGDIETLVSWYPNKSTLQRMGYLLEALHVSDEILTIIYNKLNKTAFYSVLLNHGKGEKAGKTGNRWKVHVNVKLESDL